MLYLLFSFTDQIFLFRAQFVQSILDDHSGIWKAILVVQQSKVHSRLYECIFLMNSFLNPATDHVDG